jgi:hypothetical protein
MQSGPTTARSLDARDVVKLADRHRSDPGVRIAGAVALVPGGRDPNDDSRETLAAIAAAMHRLAAELPHSPVVRAAAIRAECGPPSGPSPLDLPTDLDGSHADRTVSDVARSRATAARILEDASAGEAADPRNAFFPAMRSLALFALGRNDQARTALHEAASRDQWRDYVADEVRGAWRLRAELESGLRLWASALDYGSVRLTHPRHLRALSHVAVVCAMRRETAGDAAAGAAIRSDVLRLGGLIRTESSTIVGSLTGLAMARGAMARPGGTPVLSPPEGQRWDRERWDREITDRYVGFLDQHGLHEYVPQARAEAATWPGCRRVGDGYDWLMPLSSSVLLWWVLAMYVFAAAVWFAALRVEAAWASQQGRTRFAARQALTLTLILGACVLVPAAVGLVWTTLGGAFKGPGGMAGLGQEAAFGLISSYTGLVCSAAAVMIWFWAITVVRAVRRKTWGHGLTGWFRTVTGPLALIHVVLWAGAVGLMANAEESGMHALSQAVKHEGRYVSRLKALPWPGLPDLRAAPATRDTPSRPSPP